MTSMIVWLFRLLAHRRNVPSTNHGNNMYKINTIFKTLENRKDQRTTAAIQPMHQLRMIPASVIGNEAIHKLHQNSEISKRKLAISCLKFNRAIIITLSFSEFGDRKWNACNSYTTG